MDQSRTLRASVLAVLAVLAGRAGPARAATGGWTVGYFNTLYSPVVDPGPGGGLSEPRTSLSPPAAWASYTTGYTGGGGSTFAGLSNGYESGTQRTSVFADRLLTSPGSPTRSRSSSVGTGPAAELTSAVPPSGGSATKPANPWQMLRPSSVVALAEGAGKFFARAFRAFSSSPAESVRFDLFTRDQPTNPTRIYARKQDSVEQSTFDPSKPTKILIHGFLSHQGPRSGGEWLKNAFLAAQDCNVITVDWSGADMREYASNVKLAVPKVAAEVAELVRTLAARGLSLDDVHLVGHSLGGQIAGAAGSLVLGPAAAGRITGLDPAGPLFENRDPSQRLDPTDAAFVDIIHTDGGRLGYAGPTGHVDFYPEGGMHVQPGCGKDSVGLCSHCLAYDIIIDALQRPGATKFRSCSSWQAYQKGECEAGSKAVIGIYSDPRTRGSFYHRRTMPIREELRIAGEKDIVGLLSLRNNPDGLDGVMILHC